MGGVCSIYGEEEELYKFVVGKPEGRRQHARPRSRWDKNIKMDTSERGW